MWFLLIYLLLAGVKTQQEKIRTVLRGTGSPCKGRLEVYHNGQWGSVCHHLWDDNKNGKVVCRSLGCGNHIRSSYVTNLPIIKVEDFPPPFTMWMDRVKCNGTEESIWDCDAWKWNITQCNREHHYIVVECSGSITLSLNRKGHTDKCAGVVQFEIPNATASVCDVNWDESTADKVCKELDCGKFDKIPKPGTFQGKPRAYNLPLSCIGNEMFSWQCVDWVAAKSNACQREASVICSKHKYMRLSGGEDACSGVLQEKNSKGVWDPVPYTDDIKIMADDICTRLKCGKSTSIEPASNHKQTILRCTDRVTVELPNKCFGELYVSVNKSRQSVCSDNLSLKEQKQIGTVVCKQLGCGTLLEISNVRRMSGGEGLSQVDCTGQEESLWQCLAKHGSDATCTSSRVVCAAFEEVQLQDGYSRCSGRLEVKLEGSWWRVRFAEWKSTDSDVVCKQLGCGKSRKTENSIFMESERSFLKWNLNCQKDSQNLSQCLRGTTQKTDQKLLKSVNIICEGQKFYFLQGDRSCEGTVLDVSDGKAVNLTLEEDKWNEMANNICKQMRCGSLHSVRINSIAPQPSDSPLCADSTSDPTSNSTFNSTSNSTCSTNKKPPLNTPTTAYVNCTDSMTVRLQNPASEECWGMVTVCTGSECEGVCTDTWLDQQSKMLCENLNCGTVLPGLYGGPRDTETVRIGSVHCSDHATKISQCTFSNMTHSSCQNPAYVACTGSVKAKLTDPRKKCAGKAQLFYLGAWRSVCTDVPSAFWNTICKTMGCGNALKVKQITQSVSEEQGVSEISCTSDNITSCTGFLMESCSVIPLECEEWRQLLITTDHACSGRVYAQSKDQKLHAVSIEGWNEREGEKLCKYLQCNKYRGLTSHALPQNQTTYPLWNKSYSCSSSSEDIWDCEVEKIPTVNQHLDITCEGEPDIRLKGNCTGQVLINQRKHVCWKPQSTDRVFTELCQQLKCSSFIKSWEDKTTQNGHSFKCTGNENNLWQCSSREEKCGSVLSLACEGAVEFRFTEKCGGDVEINYRGQWEAVGFNSSTDADVICEHMQCGPSRYMDSYLSKPTEILVHCENKQSNPKHCIKASPGNYHFKTTCENYVPPVVISPPNTALISGLLVGLIILLLAIVIGISQRKTFLTMLRMRSAARDKDVELSSNEMQDLNGRNGRDSHERKSSMFEMDDYEDADLIMNAVDEESKNQELHPDEEEKRSGGSSMTEYDDVEERNDKPFASENSIPTEPLLPPRPANLLGDVSYEVELEKLEDEDDYDDAAPAPAVSPEPGDTSERSDEQVRQTDE